MYGCQDRPQHFAGIKKMPQRAQAVVDSFIFLLSLVLFSAIIWRLAVLGYSFQNSGVSTATIYIPLYPFAYGIALASIPVWLVLLVDLLKSVTMVARK